MSLYFLKVKSVINMGDMIKAVMKNFDLKSGVSSKISFCPIFICFGQNGSIFKIMIGKF